MKRHLAYFKAVLRHKWFVFLACFTFKVPIWTALLHDWDKLLPDEWLPYARTFYKEDGSKQYAESVEFARAWMLHQHRNKHHWQYWLDFHGGIDGIPIRELNILVWDRGQGQKFMGDLPPYTIGQEAFSARPMPELAIREMLADWYGAGRAYNANWTPLEPRKWYEQNCDKMILHPETRDRIEVLLIEEENRYMYGDDLEFFG